jgi:HAD superfamily hydrolase (TIGR01509 family)
MHPDLDPHHADCLLFDWDGTLVDTQRANFQAMAGALAQDGVELERAWFDARTGLSSADLVTTLVGEGALGLRRSVEDIVADRDRRFLRIAHTVKLHPPVAAVVERFRGVRPMAIASGGARHVIEHTLQHVGLRDAFDVVVTRDDVARGKPAPDIFLRAASQLRVPPNRCVVYEDSDEGIRAARAAGMAVIDVRSHTRAG